MRAPVGGQVGGLGVLDLVVADAVLAGHEDHRRGRDRGHVHRVVAGAGHDVHGRQAAALRAVAHLADQVGMEGRRREVLHLLALHRYGMPRGGVGARLAPQRVHRGERGFVLVAQVHREAHLAGDHVARTGVGVDLAHRVAAVRLVRVGDLDHRLQQMAGRVQCVLADRHRGGAGMHLHALHHHVVPAHAQRAGHHADDPVFVFQDGALLDVRLEVGVDRASAHRVGAGIADGAQLVGHRLALGVARGQRGLEREFPGEYARAHHHGQKARAFLVGPDRHFQRRVGLHAVVIEGAHDFQSGQHAVAAVELAAGGLGVDVAAGHDRRARRIASGAAREDIADLVHAHGQARVAHPAGDQVAALAVERGQRQAAIAALGRGADARQVHQRLPQPLSVDGDRGVVAHVFTSLHAGGLGLGRLADFRQGLARRDAVGFVADFQ
ncbi:Uncharacterised protein [Bordetella pertussis]|nr:Uncharacterised protein [Bordetella pertussis]